MSAHLSFWGDECVANDWRQWGSGSWQGGQTTARRSGGRRQDERRGAADTMRGDWSAEDGMMSTGGGDHASCMLAVERAGTQQSKNDGGGNGWTTAMRWATIKKRWWRKDGWTTAMRWAAVVQYLQMARWRQRHHPLIVRSLLCRAVENDENASPETIKRRARAMTRRDATRRRRRAGGL